MITKTFKLTVATDTKKQMQKEEEHLSMTYGAEEITEGRWIPVSERFPDEVGAYIVTVRDRKIPEIIGTKIDRWCLDGDKYRWIKYENPYVDNEYEIVAWMPLPEPYKEEEDADN